jgi:hypothetical protein
MIQAVFGDGMIPISRVGNSILISTVRPSTVSEIAIHLLHNPYKEDSPQLYLAS